LRFTFHNLYLIICTGFEIIDGFTSINIDVYFWFPCFKILFDVLPNTDTRLLL